MSESPKVVVVGAGIAGLAAVRRFLRVAFRVVLIDKGQRVGGRVGTRAFDVPGLGTAAFDHGAQYWLPYERADPRRGPRTEDMLSLLADPAWDAAVRPWYVHREDGSRVHESVGYAAVGGMRELAVRLAPKPADGVDFRLQTRVESVEPSGRWKVRTDDGELVNADGLVLTAPLPQSLDLIDRQDISFPAAEWDELRRVEYTRCLAVLLVLADPLGLGVGGMQYENGPITFIAENRTKSISAVGPALTVLTSHDFALANWDASDEQVAAAVAAALPEWARRPVVASQVKRWRYAQVVQPFPEPFALHRDPPLAVAGDAFHAAGFGTGINRAFASGTLAADRLIRLFSTARRLSGTFEPGERKGRIVLEVAVTSADEAMTAVGAGADRLEVCSHLDCGGLTPSLGAFRAVREAVRVPVYVLLRPRAGGFNYTPDELDVMRRDAELFLDGGADGVVFGVLNSRGGIAESACREFVKLADGRAVFHRAFDFVGDVRKALPVLVGLGFERVQTSGGRPAAAEGAARIAEAVRHAAWDIEVLPAGGIDPSNVAALLDDTGCNLSLIHI